MEAQFINMFAAVLSLFFITRTLPYFMGKKDFEKLMASSRFDIACGIIVAYVIISIALFIASLVGSMFGLL